jgi:lysophospholipase L1-like esterase
LILEILLRVYGPSYQKFNNRSREYYSNPRGYHIPLRKENNETIYGLKYNFDNNGFRIPLLFTSYDNITAKKTDKTIMGVGDSFTFGQGVKYKDLYLSRLQRLLEDSDYNISVKNLGLPGGDLKSVLQVYAYFSHRIDPSLVVYGFVLNDFGVPGLKKDMGFEFIDFNSPKYRYNPLRNISRIYNFICYLIDRKRLHDITLKAYLDAFKGKNAENKFLRLKKLNYDIKQKGDKLIIVLFPLLYDFDNYPFRKIHNKISAFCEKEDILLLDLFPAYSRYKAEELWVNPRDHHPNEIAHKITAEELYAFIESNKVIEK